MLYVPHLKRLILISAIRSERKYYEQKRVLRQHRFSYATKSPSMRLRWHLHPSEILGTQTTINTEQ